MTTTAHNPSPTPTATPTAPLTAEVSSPPQLAHGHGQNSQPAVDNQRGLVRFANTSPTEQLFSVPSGLEEQWRFTPASQMAGLVDTQAPQPLAQVMTLAVSPSSGVKVEQVGGDDSRLGQLPGPVDFVSQRAWHQAMQPTGHRWVVSIGADVDPSQLVEISVQAPHDTNAYVSGAAAYGHLLIEVAPHAQATVLFRTQGLATYADNVEIRVGANAQLRIMGVLDWHQGSVHVGAHSIELGADASVHHGLVSLTGALTRMSTSVSYAGAGGQATLLGVYVADAGHHRENRLFVDHSQPHCKSRVEYKGALQGSKARAVWVGDVLIRSAAEGTDTYELNRNLILTPGGQADSVPNLEIETGEIQGAGHASTTGRFDEEQLFYLMARGLDRQQARQLVVRGFFADLINQMGIPQVAEKLTEQIEQELHPSFTTSHHSESTNQASANQGSAAGSTPSRGGNS